MLRDSRLLRITLLVLSILLAPKAMLADEFSFTTIDASTTGNVTRVYGINNSGQIVGTFLDGAGYHAFVGSSSGGTYTSFNHPSATDETIACGINDSGQIVGDFRGETGRFTFVLDNGVFSSVDPPGNNIGGAIAQGINDAGQIVGAYFDSSIHAFLRNSDGSFLEFNAPGATATWAYGINNSGEIVGTFYDGSGSHGFLRDSNGTYTEFDVLGAVGTTFAYGINNFGQVVGGFTNPYWHGFLRSSDGSTYTTIDDPNTTTNTTFAYGINDAEQIVGLFDDTLSEHGFVASPVPEPSSLILLVGASLLLLSARRRWSSR